MTIKQLGGVFGRNPTFNDVTIEGELTFEGDIDVNSDLKVNGDLDVVGDITAGNQAFLKTVISEYSMEVGGQYGKMVGTKTGSGVGGLEFYSYSGGLYKTADLTNSGNLNLTTGNLIVSSGAGIDFSATAGTGTSELLDDYEEGTWTPAFAFDIGGTGIVYGTRSGKYTKIGNTVCVDFQLNVASGISVADYFVRLSGIPFNCANDGLNIGRVWIQNPNSASFNLSVQGGSDSLICFTDNAASGAGSYARGDDVVGVTISGSFTYRTS